MGPMNAKLFVAVIVMTSPDLDDIAQIILSINVIGPRKESRGVGSRDPRHSELEGVESGVDMLTNSNDEPLGQPVAEPANLPNARQIPRILSFLDGHKRRPSLAYIQALGSTCHRYDAACLNWQEVRFLQEIQNSASVTLSEFLGQALYKNGGQIVLASAMFDKIFKKRPQDLYADPQVTRNSMSTNEHEKGPSDLVDTPIPLLTWRSLVMGLLVSMGGFLFGYDTGQISGFLEMKDFLHRYGEPQSDGTYHFSNVRSGLIVALLSIGTLIGALVAAPIADRLGRKWSISWWSLMVCIGITVQISSPFGKWYQVAMGRWVAGLGVGAISLLVPMYQAESGPRHIRGSLISTYQLFITLGIFVANCINYGTEARTDTGSWRIPMGITYLWAIILGAGMMFFPESPRYDYRNGKIDKAKSTLAKIYGIPHNHRALHLEFDEIRQKHEEEKRNGQVSWIQMFSAPTMGYRVAVGVALQALQQLTGANYFFYYGTTIFNGAGIKNSYVTQMILGGVNFGTTFLGLYLIEHYGRRRSLIAGALWMFVCFMIFASVGHFSLDREDPEKTKSAGVAMVVFACLFILGFASTWGPMVWTIIAELYPSQYRARAMSLATASNWLWNFLLAFFTPFITGDIDFRFGYVFAGCLFLAAALVYFAVIEGQGRTLEEIDTMYRMGVKPWKSSKFQFPPDPDLNQDSLNKEENAPMSSHVADPNTELREDGSWMPETHAQS